MQEPSNFEEFATVLREFIHVSARSGAHGQDLEAAFNRLAVALFHLQVSRNSIYREFCHVRGAEPLEVTHWNQIPALPTAAFKEFEVSCFRPIERTAAFHSSGTTEPNRSRHFHNLLSLGV